MAFEYNTTEDKLRFPAYGRLVQEMIDEAVAEPNAKRRQKMAERIITVMADLNPQIQASPNFLQTLWNHLAFISDYKLDINYPVEIERADKSAPRKLSYPGNKIRFRQYGHLIENTLDKLKNMPANSPGRNKMLMTTIMRMRRCITEWKGDDVENEKVCHDIALYTDNVITADEILNMLKEREQHAFVSNRTKFNQSRKGGRFYRR